MERASLYTHTAFGESLARLNEDQSFLFGLIDVLLAKGYITENELTSAVEKVRAELAQRSEQLVLGTIVRVDTENDSVQKVVEVDCNQRMHICKAVCCRLDFALTVPEIESGRIQWDLGRPYFIRNNANGCCIHNESESGSCNIYSNLPGVCKRYSCADDKRIWKNFEQMELGSALV